MALGDANPWSIANGQPWIFTQKSGKKRELKLAGWSGPFGRPRQKAVVEDGIKIRHQTTRYPDSVRPPTRHVLGPDYPEWEINGRWMDRELGAGGALAKMREAKTFVADAQQCTIQWGGALLVDAWIAELKIGIESDAQIAWSMKIEIDTDNFEPDPIGASNYAPPPAVKLIAMDWADAPAMPQKPVLHMGILDALDDAISAVTGAIGQLAVFADQVRSFENALVSDINRLRQGVLQVKTAIATVQALVAPIENVSEQAADDARSVVAAEQAAVDFFRAHMDIILIAIMAQLAELDAAAAIALAAANSATTAIAGESWESIANRVYGSPARANDVRVANGAQYGAQPIAGHRLILP